MRLQRYIPSLAGLGCALLLASCDGQPIAPVIPGPGELSMLKVSGDNQVGFVGLPLPKPIVVKVVDKYGKPVKGQIVNFVVVAGGGSVFGGASIANANGISQELWTLGTVAGSPQKLEARYVDATTGAPVVLGSFTATAVAGAPVAVNVTPDSVGLVPASTAQLVATAVDKYGNSIASPILTWSSSDPAVATVSQAGLVTGMAGGVASVRATAGGVSDAAVITVIPPPNLVLFQSARTGAAEIYSIHPDGTGEIQLTTAGGTTPDLAPDNRTVAFVRGWNIWLMDVDGSNQRQLTFYTGQTFMSSPRWSPDGSLIAFWMEHNSSNLTSEIYVVRRDGSGLQQLTSNSNVIDIHPGWTPDGRVEWTASNGGGLRVINPDGTGEGLLVPMASCGLGSGGYAQFSPDGTRILYEGETSCGGGIEVFVMAPNGSNRIQLTSSGSSRAPSWSPDGSQIVYSRSDVGGAGPFQLYLMNANGSNPTPLTFGTTDVMARWR